MGTHVSFDAVRCKRAHRYRLISMAALLCTVLVIGHSDPIEAAPAAPTNLIAATASSRQIVLTWTDNATTETGYEVERSPGGSRPWTMIAALGANATSYQDNGLPQNTRFYYRVRSKAGPVYSRYSPIASAITAQLAAPSGLTASVASATKIVLSWNDNTSYEALYSIERSPNGSSSWNVVGMVASNDTTTTISGLTTGITYYFRIRAYDGKNYSTYSNTTNQTIRTITATAGPNGAISPSGTVGIASGSNQAFTITPNSGYRIASVAVNGSAVTPNPTYTFTNIISNQAIYATFVPNTYTITATAGPNGTMSPAGSVVMSAGSGTTFIFTPITGYHVSDVQVDGISIGAPSSYTFSNVATDHIISVMFSVNTYTIMASAGTNGTITPSGAITVVSGATPAFTATPGLGYRVLDMQVDGVIVGSSPTYTFAPVTDSHTILAAFTELTYTLMASAGPNGTIIPSGAMSANYGSNQTFTISPNAGYSIADVIIDGSSVATSGTCTFGNIVSSHTIMVSFADITPPTGSLVINGGATATNTQLATLMLSAADAGSGIAQMKFSNDGSIWSTPEPYATSKNWLLPAGDGTKSVFAKFMDSEGNWMAVPASTFITLDTEPPTVTIISPQSGIQNTRAPLLMFAVSDGNTIVSVDNVAVTAGNGDHLGPLSEGDHVVRVESTDAAGNIGHAEVTLTVRSVIPVVTAAQSLSMGDYHVLVIKMDGSLWAWGDNEHGQLGDGTTINRNVQTLIGPEAQWKTVSAGGNHTAALTMSGELWMWGYNAFGQLGDGTTTDRLTPVLLETDPANPWATVSAGSYHTAAIRADGTLWAWGSNGSGELGDGSTMNRSTPVRIGTEADWTAVAAGTYHTVALKSDGSLWAWGHNAFGELGDGSTNSSTIPRQIGLGYSWVLVAAGCYHTVALRSDGSLWAWGLNDTGQLGNGSTSDQQVPVQIGTENDWMAVAAGSFHTAALKRDGTLWTWGMNASGQLGDDTFIDRTVPTWIAASDWNAVAGGMTSSAAMKSDGTIAIWGGNGFGQLGNGYSVHRSVPVRIGSNANWRTASGGFGYSLALKIDGTLWAWGDNAFGQLGTGTNKPSAIPLQVGSEQNWDKIAAGENHALALKTDGSLWAWGSNARGQIGDGSTMNRSAPVRISPSSEWFAVSAGKEHSLGIRSDGSLWAWGANEDGQLGDGTTVSSVAPIQISQSSAWIAVAAGQRTSYAIRSDGALFAWGAGERGELGNRTWNSSPVPVPVDPAWAPSIWDDVSAGTSHTLAIRKGELCAWGRNDHGQLTNGWNQWLADRNEPTCPDGALDWVQSAAGLEFSLGRKLDGTIWSWGNNVYGQLGDGTTVERYIPWQIGLSRDWAFIAAGKQHALAIKTDSTLWTWGYNSHGQAGTGDQGVVQQPAIMSMTGAVRISGGADLTKNPGVSIDLSAIDGSIATTVQFSNNGIDWSVPTAFAVNTTWNIIDPIYGGTSGNGSKTVYARFQDANGDLSAVFSTSITLDRTPPSIEITSPINGMTYTDLPILIYSVNEGYSKVKIQGSDPAFETLTSGSLIRTISHGGWNYITVHATDAAGNSSSKTVRFNVLFPSSGGSGSDPDTGNSNCDGTGKYVVKPSNFYTGIIVPVAGSGLVNISSPENFSIINGTSVIVKGAMDTAVPIKNVKVTVGSAMDTVTYPAQVNGNYFAAKVPVAADGTIAVIATDMNNMQHQNKVTVFVNNQTPAVELSAGPDMGVVSMKLDGRTTFDIGLSTATALPQPAQYYAWDLSGTGYSDVICLSHSNIQVRYEQSGLYESRVTVYSGGRAYHDSVIVNVLDRNEMDAIFKPIWNGMKSKLGSGDIEGAVGSFSEYARDAWRNHFTRLSQYLSQIVVDMGEFHLVQVTDWIVEYDLRTIRNGEEYSFQVLFMRDEDGSWKIKSF